MTDLREVARDTNALLTAYIVVHDGIFGGGIRRLIPIPGIFKPIEFCQHAVTLHTIASELAVYESMVLVSPPGDSSHTDLRSSLLKFLRALIETVTQLELVSQRSCRVSENQGHYSLAEYRQDVDTYHRLVATYREHGERLNAHYGRAGS